MRVTSGGRSGRSRIAFAALAAGLLIVVLADGALALAAVSVHVDATANPWAAGGGDPILDGTRPPEIEVPQGATTLSFPGVSGSWSNTGPMLPADGEPPIVGTAYECGGQPPCTVLPSNGLSGLTDAARFWYLTGVFIGTGTLGGSQPPPTIDFTGLHEFTILEPALGQVFFIGDGRTSGGTVQLFRVPAGSTRLVLGMVDICTPGEAAGCYYDNSGSLEVTATWGSAPDTATLPPPAALGHDGTGPLLAAVGAIAFLIALRLSPAPGRRDVISGGSPSGPAVDVGRRANRERRRGC